MAFDSFELLDWADSLECVSEDGQTTQATILETDQIEIVCPYQSGHLKVFILGQEVDIPFESFSDEYLP